MSVWLDLRRHQAARKKNDHRDEKAHSLQALLTLAACNAPAWLAVSGGEMRYCLIL
jgi:hypothetical protein